MQKLKIDQDIRSLSEVRNAMASYIKQVHDTKRPVIITQHGKGVAVLLGANEFEAMQEKIELLSDVQTSLNQLAKGEGISHQKAKDKLLSLKDLVARIPENYQTGEVDWGEPVGKEVW